VLDEGGIGRSSALGPRARGSRTTTSPALSANPATSSPHRGSPVERAAAGSATARTTAAAFAGTWRGSATRAPARPGQPSSCESAGAATASSTSGSSGSPHPAHRSRDDRRSAHR